MISFSETVLNVTPNKPEEENIIPYTYEETVMCIYEYGECYKNLNKELSLFSEADGTDNPGKIQRLMTWLRKMWERFKAWFKRVFGFVNANSKVDPETASATMEKAIKSIDEYSKTIKPIFEDVSNKVTDINKSGGPNTVGNANPLIMDAVIKCAGATANLIKNTILFKQGKEYIDNVFKDSGRIQFTAASIFKAFPNSEKPLSIVNDVVNAIKTKPQDTIAIRDTYLQLFQPHVTSTYKEDDINTLFSLVTKRPADNNYVEFGLKDTYAKLYAGIVECAFENKPISNVTNRLKGFRVTTNVDDAYDKVKLADGFDSVEQAKLYANFINGFSAALEIENGIRTNGFLVAMLMWFEETAKRLEIEMSVLEKESNK